jgi:hydrogenase expression/formation protein HypE
MSEAERKAPPALDGLQCPPPSRHDDLVVLGHGSGGRLTAELVRRVFLPALSNPALERLNDSAELDAGGRRVVFTTDSFVVSPLRFPGGDIGSLAVNGTINDLAVVGAEPLGLSAAFILEEGFPIAELAHLAQSMRAAADRAGVAVVAADTKVVERGKADGLFITTSGIGVVPDALELGPERARPGDAVIVSGHIGDHGIAVMSAREGLEFETTVMSDSAPLNGLVAAMLAGGAGAVRCMRDATRGGVATVLNELAQSSHVELVIEEQALPVREAVRAACEILGLDPLYVACEGRLVAIVGAARAAEVLAAMRRHPLGRAARRIGAVTRAGQPRVLLRTAFGPTRTLDPLPGALLPRIC